MRQVGAVRKKRTVPSLKNRQPTRPAGSRGTRQRSRRSPPSGSRRRMFASIIILAPPRRRIRGIAEYGRNKSPVRNRPDRASPSLTVPVGIPPGKSSGKWATRLTVRIKEAGARISASSVMKSGSRSATRRDGNADRPRRSKPRLHRPATPDFDPGAARVAAMVNHPDVIPRTVLPTSLPHQVQAAVFAFSQFPAGFTPKEPTGPVAACWPESGVHPAVPG